MRTAKVDMLGTGNQIITLRKLLVEKTSHVMMLGRNVILPVDRVGRTWAWMVL